MHNDKFLSTKEYLSSIPIKNPVEKHHEVGQPTVNDDLFCSSANICICLPLTKCEKGVLFQLAMLINYFGQERKDDETFILLKGNRMHESQEMVPG